jgi:putative hydrolase of the HAD superfamily
MILKNNKTSFIVLDLDDTIYKEVEFVKSGFRAIIQNYANDQDDQDLLFNVMMNAWQAGQNAILTLFNHLNLQHILIDEPLKIYHTHSPNITLSESSKSFFEYAKAQGLKLGLITDGRSITQRNKLESLGIGSFFNEIIVSEEFGSEKPAMANYKIFENKYPEETFCYIGDNTTKDFIVPAILGWEMYCIIDDGSNIHNQELGKLPSQVKLLKDLKQLFDDKP